MWKDVYSSKWVAKNDARQKEREREREKEGN